MPAGSNTKCHHVTDLSWKYLAQTQLLSRGRTVDKHPWREYTLHGGSWKHAHVERRESLMWLLRSPGPPCPLHIL